MGKFEVEHGGVFGFSDGTIRICMCKLAWTGFSTLRIGGYLFWAVVLMFQLVPPLRLTWDIIHRRFANKQWIAQHSLLLGSELGVLGLIAFLVLLVPTMIMTWITVLVIQHLFGAGLLGRRQFIQEGSLIAKDIAWLAIKSTLKRGNVLAFVVLIVALLIGALPRGPENQQSE